MINTEVKAHSEFSASGSKRWVTCPASIPLSKLAPALPDNAAGKHGTDGHTCLEAFMNKPKSPYTVKNFLLKTFPKEMVQHAQEAFEIIHKIAAAFPGSEIRSETKVDTSHFTEPGNFGTVDCAIVELFGTLTVIDYKYGVMPVDPKDNTQGICYALGIAREFDYNFRDVHITIIQPRGRDTKEVVRTWKTTMKELRRWEPVFRMAVEEARGPDPTVSPGSHCFFCPSRTFNCPAHIEKVNSRAQEDFEFDTPEDEEFDLDKFLDISPEKPSPRKRARNKAGTNGKRKSRVH